MKTFFSFLLLATLTTVAFADIQDPPANDFGPTRKLARGFANVIPLTHLTELVNSVAILNEREGNSSAFTYGVVKGVGRSVFRFGVGWYELFTFPFPTYKGSYRPFYQSTIPYIHGGYDEFPPELGFESRYRYVRQGTVY